MKFKVSNANGIAVTRIKPYTITEVTFNGIESKTGTAKTGREWQAIQLRFTGDGGAQFEPMVFYPGEDGDQRREGDNNGRHWILPSSSENLYFTFNHMIAVLCGTTASEKYSKAIVGKDLTFDQYFAIVQKLLSPAVGTKVFLKVVGNSNGYATIPNTVSISKDGDAYLNSNWLSKDSNLLGFSSYEKTKADNYHNAKPTSVESDSATSVDESKDDGGLNLDDL